MNRSRYLMLLGVALLATACNNPTASSTSGADASPAGAASLAPGATPEVAVTPEPAGPVLQAQFDTVSVERSKKRDIIVTATVAGATVPFTASPEENDCFSVVPSSGKVVVIAKDQICSDQFTITADGIPNPQSVTVNVFDPKVMDIGEGLLITYVDTFDFRWNDAGTGSRTTTGMYHPKVAAGWFALGSYITTNDALADGKAWMIVAQDSKNVGALAAPIDWQWLWADSGSGGDFDAAMYLPVCPNGYVAMGVITNPVSPDDVRCVAERFAVLAVIGAQITSDSGSGGDYDYGINRLDPPRGQLPDGATALATNTVSANNTAGYYLKAKLPVYEESSVDTRPRLTSCTPLSAEDLARPISVRSTRVPFTLLGSESDATTIAGRVGNVRTSPFYVLRRETRWSEMSPGSKDNCGKSQGSVIVAHSQNGVSAEESSSFSKEVGVSVSVGGDIGPVSTEVNVSYTLGWNSSETKIATSETGVEVTECVPAGHIMQFLAQTTVLTAVTSSGAVESTVSAGMPGTAAIEWPNVPAVCP